MNYFSILSIAIGLSMDAFAVAVSNGMLIKRLKWTDALKFGCFFGFFQLIMPILGYIFGSGFQGHISSIDHWIAFGLLSLIGGKMIYESFQSDEQRNINDKSYILSFKNMISLSIATSIDALAVGVGFAVTNTSILPASIIIGLVAFTLSTLGALLGKKIGGILQHTAERFGGVILIAIGFQILVKHTVLK